MKICIDTFCCESGASGVGSYITSLIKNLAEQDDITFELLGSAVDKYTYNSDCPQIKYNSVRKSKKSYSKILWHKFSLNKFLKKNKIDLIIFPVLYKICPISKKINGIAIVNAVLSDVLKNYKSTFMKKIIIKSYNRMKKIIVSTEFLRDDLCSLGIDKDKIVVIKTGLDHTIFYPQTELFQNDFVDIKPFAIKRPYFIYPSKLSSPTKKHIELIKAFELFKEKNKTQHRLVLAGEITKYAETIQKAITKNKYASDIIITGYFPHENLRELYIGSDGCIFPAVGEGVGMPLLEAMSCGVSVACSNSAANPKTVNGNGILFNSDNIEEIRDAMEKIISNSPDLDRMKADGIRWTNTYSWKKTATKIIEILVACK